MKIYKLLLILCPVFFIACLGSGFQNEQPVERRSPLSKFSDPTGQLSYDTYKFDYSLRFKGVDTTWEKDKNIFYGILTNNIAYENYQIFRLHKDSSEAEIYDIFSIDGFGGMWSYSFDTCMGSHIKERNDIVYEFCKKNIHIPESLYAKMKSFLLEKKPSVFTYFADCFEYLSIIYYDGERNYYFDMSKPSCLDENIKKDPRIPEYIDFYNEMAAFIKQDFSACRWDNFGNKEKMIRECGKFNWRWKDKYPEILGR
ncbi:hypothetical protein [Fibrobacter sp. UWB10]|uniref:hypothetical protein n=1 Tax=Fibrobacter sp. UWB10 TaxID=1896201 RepID=UPI0024036719|nr:hypothetical protein [Fibrobacter sp. UWB10]SMP46370.1 hypothetical protein SAMN05720465_1237 [Fibrobacter sp. UWB10]